MNVLKIMEKVKRTYKQRSKLYKNNYTRIGYVLAALFPDGITLKTFDDFNKFHLFMMLVIKITRLACTDLKHKDSTHDIAVYATMYEALLDKEEQSEDNHS